MRININRLISVNIKQYNPLKPLAILLFIIFPAATLAAGNLNVFSCEPEWASLAQSIGGDKVSVFSATHAKQNPHFIRARPSLIAKIRKADLVFCSGGGLEVGWLPVLIQRANQSVQPGTPGYLMASDFVPVLEIPTVVDRSHGDIHPEGNPHVHLNPENILPVAIELQKRLASIDSSNSEYYGKQLEAFTKKWNTSLKKWTADIAALENKPVIVHHKSLSYLIDWANMNEIGAIEPKPGLPPTMHHLKSLLSKVKEHPNSIIIKTPYDTPKGAKWLSNKTGQPVLTLPYTVDGDENSKDLFQLFSQTIKMLKSTGGA